MKQIDTFIPHLVIVEQNATAMIGEAAEKAIDGCRRLTFAEPDPFTGALCGIGAFCDVASLD